MPTDRELGITIGASASNSAVAGGGFAAQSTASVQLQPGIMTYLPPRLRARFLPGSDFQKLYLQSRFNASQQEAITSVVRSGGFSLIQGPPGEEC